MKQKARSKYSESESAEVKLALLAGGASGPCTPPGVLLSMSEGGVLNRNTIVGNEAKPEWRSRRNTKDELCYAVFCLCLAFC